MLINPLLPLSKSVTHQLPLIISLTPAFTALFLCFALTENNRTPLQRSRSRQNINASAAAVKASHANEARNEAEGRPAPCQPKASTCSEAGRRVRNPTGHSSRLDRERASEREAAKEAEHEPAAFRPTSGDAALSSCSTNGESDVEALLAKLRAL